MKRTILSILISSVLALGSCAENTGCIDEALIESGPCTLESNPVCGCDGKTYGNPCEARRAGVTKYRQGGCK